MCLHLYSTVCPVVCDHLRIDVTYYEAVPEASPGAADARFGPPPAGRSISRFLILREPAKYPEEGNASRSHASPAGRGGEAQGMWPSVYSFTITNTLSLSEVSLYATKSCYSAGGTYTPRLASEFIMLDVISSVIIRPPPTLIAMLIAHRGFDWAAWLCGAWRRTGRSRRELVVAVDRLEELGTRDITLARAAAALEQGPSLIFRQCCGILHG